jgi:hypothetical protein
VDVQINVLPGMEDGMSKVMINPQRKKSGDSEPLIITMGMHVPESNLSAVLVIYLIMQN